MKTLILNRDNLNIFSKNKAFEEIEYTDFKNEFKEFCEYEVVEFHDGDRVKFLKHRYAELNKEGEIVYMFACGENVGKSIIFDKSNIKNK